jgi:hypothetical protein
MANNDDFWGGIILGGLMGAGIASPKPEEKQELQQYRATQQQLLARKQRIGNLNILDRLRQKPSSFNLFVESCNMFIYGFFRGACVFSIAVIENELREKYKEENFKKLIDKAKDDKLIEPTEEHYLNGLRLDRNSLVHNASREINENESLMIIHLAIRIMERIL